MINVCILGASGSIGKQALDVIRSHPDKFNLVSFTVGKNLEYAKEILNEFPSVKVFSTQENVNIQLIEEQYSGEEGLIKCATASSVDVVLVAVVGFVGLVPTLKAIEHNKTIALANKETLVCAGDIVMKKAKEYNVKIIPVDSEHSAIYQCLKGNNYKDIDKLIITASGGSFRDKSRKELQNVTVDDALNHPNWSMGNKITIDSATMFNKGLEVIEAHHLFNIDYKHIEVIIHNESIIHSMVQFKDYSVLAQLGNADMRLPIIYALSNEERFYTKNFEQLDLVKTKSLNFKEVDFKRYPALKMSIDAGKIGGSMPTVLNAAKEVAVDLFLERKISFLQIERIVYKALSEHKVLFNPSINDIIRINDETREKILKEV